MSAKAVSFSGPGKMAGRVIQFYELLLTVQSSRCYCIGLFTSIKNKTVHPSHLAISLFGAQTERSKLRNKESFYAEYRCAVNLALSIHATLFTI